MKDITSYNEEDEPHGYWEVYWDNGNPRFKGNYDNGLTNGYCEYYHSNGYWECKGNFYNGIPHGYWEWYVNGKLKTQIFYS